MKTRKAELLRKKYRYRRLIMTGRISLPHTAARRLIGPDCAYHLYGHLDQPGCPNSGQSGSSTDCEKGEP